MPSTSKTQQRLMGVAYSVKKGDVKLKDVDAAYREKVQQLVASMTLQQLKDFAETKHKDLPEDIQENIDHEVKMANNQLESIVEAAYQLMDYLGEDEKNIPAWIQDHIAQAYNYIKQAADGYHELEEMITPASIGGMGSVSFPTSDQTGSGDVPNGKKKKKKTRIIESFRDFLDI